MRVWDRVIRGLHWTLVVSVAIAWLSTLWFYGLHEGAGYVALAVVLLRLLWGFSGPRYARFAQFVRGPRATWRYSKLTARGDEPRHIGHNPLGAWMVLALLGCVLGLGVTGWLYRSDWLWGDETVELVHQTLARLLLGLIALHVGGVVFTSRRQRENLIAAMFSGRKRAASAGDVD